MPMDRRAFKAGIAVLLILVSFLAGMLTDVVVANPWMGQPVPPSMRTPNRDSPILEVQSPENTTYYQNEGLLNFTVTKPESWVTTNVSCFITGVVYQIDGNAVVLFNWSDPDGNHSLPSPEQFSVTLGDLEEGQHTLQVNVSAYSRYWTTPEFGFFYEDYPLNVSETVNFAIAEKPLPSPSVPELTPFASMLALVVVTCIVLVAAKKRLMHKYQKPICQSKFSVGFISARGVESADQSQKMPVK